MVRCPACGALVLHSEADVDDPRAQERWEPTITSPARSSREIRLRLEAEAQEKARQAAQEWQGAALGGDVQLT
jgi:hypothetical protein